ncbi:metallo-beta-lactamase superfamily hydrolase [hydrocarbon metagenome]|uniref:Metallo-beta-lactamase superfamily hydrolase n=1 Tax=hydrocarbon metagenome TaxID=938273 RepID=A0A0W8E721_9ZZZZ
MDDLLCLRLGITNCYLIKGYRGYIMIDAGSLRKEKLFLALLAKQHISPQDIDLIIITHAHFDHIGSLAGIKRMCSCPVLAHPVEARIMREGEIVIPPGTNMLGSAVSFLGKRVRPLLAFEPVESEITIDCQYDLGEFGIKGKILPTPGHTIGSLSVLLTNGNALVGDLAANLTGLSVYPPFAEMPAEIYSSWGSILRHGGVNIFPAHGRPFSIERCLAPNLISGTIS